MAFLGRGEGGGRRALLIVNPAARRARRIRRRVEEALRASLRTVEIAATTQPGHARDMARARSVEFDLVFSLGGDGTVNEVADGLAGTGVPLAPLPGGTGNLVCRAIGVPLAPHRAVAALLAGTPRAIDLARTDRGACVVFAAGAGIDAAMIAGATGDRKRRWGVATYFLTGARAAFARQGFGLRATVDGEAITSEAWAVFVANFGPVLGGLLTLGPGIAPDDGALDLCIYSPRHIRDAFALTWRMFRADFRPHPCMRFVRGREISIETTPVRPFQSDGELTGTTPVRLRVEPQALTLVMPPPGSRSSSQVQR